MLFRPFHPILSSPHPSQRSLRTRASPHYAPSCPLRNQALRFPGQSAGGLASTLIAFLCKPVPFRPPFSPTLLPQLRLDWLPSFHCLPLTLRHLPPTCLHLPPTLLPQLRLDKALRLGPYLGLYLRGRAGAVLGDLPPYEAFPIGGTNSVRGYAGAAARGGAARGWQVASCGT